MIISVKIKNLVEPEENLANDGLPKSSWEFIVVHVRLGLPLTPSSGDFIRVCELKLSIGTLPCNAVSVTGVWQQLKKELPQLDLAWTCHMERIIS